MYTEATYENSLIELFRNMGSGKSLSMVFYAHLLQETMDYNGSLVKTTHEKNIVNRVRRWYWFDEAGRMATGWRTINGQRYFFDENGVWQPAGQK